MSSSKVMALRKKLLGDRLNDWQAYHALIASHLCPGLTILDIGCGRGAICPFPWESHQDINLIGLDPDPTAADNPYLKGFTLLTDEERWSVESESIDLALARYVLEHVASPDLFMANVFRVLRPGGRFIFLSPNKYHPGTWPSRVLPQSWKRHLLGRMESVEAEDVFPTYYRLNSAGSVSRAACKHKLLVEQLLVREYVPIGYLDFSVPTFYLAYLFYLVVSRTGLERSIGGSIIGVLLKPDK